MDWPKRSAASHSQGTAVRAKTYRPNVVTATAPARKTSRSRWFAIQAKKASTKAAANTFATGAETAIRPMARPATIGVSNRRRLDLNVLGAGRCQSDTQSGQGQRLLQGMAQQTNRAGGYPGAGQ